MEKRDDPSTPSAAYERMAPGVTLIQDILDGPVCVRAKGKLYLPQNAAEADDEYAARLKEAPWSPEFDDILRSLASKPFGEEVAFPPNEHISESIKSLAEDIDGRGNNLTAFARPVFKQGIAKGFHAILVDNTGDGTARTKEQERVAGVRPYWVGLKVEDIIDLKTAFIGGRELPYHVRIKECAVLRDGYAEKHAVRIREINREPTVDGRGRVIALGPPVWQLHEQQTDAAGLKTWVMVDQGVLAPLTEIPLAMLWTGEREGAQFVRPPLAALADKQMELYRESSKKERAFTMSASPMLSANGLGAPEKPGVVEIGPNRVLYAPTPQGSWSYVVAPAENLKELRANLAEIRDDIRRLGMQPLTAQSGGVTATASSIEGAKAHSAVQAWALGLKDVLEQAFVYTSQWLGEDATVQVKVDTEFAVEPFAQPPLDALTKARQAGDLSRRTYWEGLQRFSVLGPDFDPDAEEANIEQEPPPLGLVGAPTLGDSGQEPMIPPEGQQAA